MCVHAVVLTVGLHHPRVSCVSSLWLPATVPADSTVGTGGMGPYSVGAQTWHFVYKVRFLGEICVSQTEVQPRGL